MKFEKNPGLPKCHMRQIHLLTFFRNYHLIMPSRKLLQNFEKVEGEFFSAKKHFSPAQLAAAQEQAKVRLKQIEERQK